MAHAESSFRVLAVIDLPWWLERHAAGLPDIGNVDCSVVKNAGTVAGDANGV